MTTASWNLVEDVRQMLAYDFMVNTVRAGSVVAVTAAVVGYLMVLRRQAFAGHTLSLIGFPGAAGATLLGLGASLGYVGFCLAGAVAVAAFPDGARSARSAGSASAAIGTVQAFALASGMLFVSLYGGFLSGLDNLLFGSITGVTDDQVLGLVACAAVCLGTLAVVGRPLLFASVDPSVARGRGVPVRALSTVFMLVLGLAAAGASQITGSLLVFALLVMPAATALRVTSRPVAGLVLSVLVALGLVWAAAGVAFFTPYPMGFWVTTLGFASYVAASVGRAVAARAGRSVRRSRTHRGAVPS